MRTLAIVALALASCGDETKPAPVARPRPPVDAAPPDAAQVSFEGDDRLPGFGLFGEKMGLASDGPVIVWIAVDLGHDIVRSADRKGKVTTTSLPPQTKAHLVELGGRIRGRLPSSNSCSDYREILAIHDGAGVRFTDTGCPIDGGDLGELATTLWSLHPPF